jgi:hypothetical protein
MLEIMIQKSKASRPGALPRTVTSISAEAALSFLKETKGLLTWTAQSIADALKISRRDAEQVIAFLEAQGYVRRHENEWMTTPAGESVSGAKQPRFTRESVTQALDVLRHRIKEHNRDAKARFRVTDAVAFGDFLDDDRTRIQAADVGIRLVPRADMGELRSASEASKERQFLQQLRARSPMLNLRPFADWMAKRSHRKLT